MRRYLISQCWKWRRRRKGEGTYQGLCASFSSSSSSSSSKDPSKKKTASSPRPTPPGCYTWRDLPYYSSEGGCDIKQHLDIYIASSPFPRPLQPLFLFVHGGFWVRGDRQHPNLPGIYDNIGAACAKAGCVGVIVSYRLSPTVRHPEHIRDVARALKWTITSASRYGGDASRIFLAGHSAGSHLCTTLLSSPELLAEADLLHDDQSPVAGLIGMAGVFNLERLSKGPLVTSFMPFVFGEDEALWNLASPVHILRKHRQEQQQKAGIRRLLPIEQIPLFLLNAEADFHLEEDTKELYDLLRATENEDGEDEEEIKAQEAGRTKKVVGTENGSRKPIERTALTIPGTDHISLVNRMGRRDGEKVDDAVFSFIKRHSS